MDEDVRGLESRIDDLGRRLAAVEAQVEELRSPATAASAPASTDLPPITEEPAHTVPAQTHGLEAPPAESPGSGIARSIPLIGRSLVVMGGAFFLRYCTESELVPPGAGISLGLLYAFVWLAMARRSRARGHRLGPEFHGLTAVAIAFPLLGEATGSFGLVSPWLAGALIAITAGAAFALAAEQSLRGLAWFTYLAAAITSFSLISSTGTLAPFALDLVAMGGITLWLAYLRRWTALAAIAALMANFIVALATLLSMLGNEHTAISSLSTGTLIGLQLSLIAVYFASFVVRALPRGRDLSFSEILQTLSVFGIGYGGALLTAGRAGQSLAPLGVVGLVLGVACYAASFAFIDKRRGGRQNFVLFTSLALVLTLTGLGVLLDGAGLALALAAAALFAASLGGIRGRATLTLHGAAYVLGAAAATGLLGFALNAFNGADAPPFAAAGLPVMLVLVATAACCWWRVETRGRTWGEWVHVPKAIMLAVLAAGLGAVAVSLLAPLLPTGDASSSAEVSSSSDGPSAAALATLRTAILAISAVALAWAGGLRRLPQAAWLVYPVLAVGGLKLIIQDLRSGEPLAIFVSLAFFGGALILAPRLLKRRSPPREDPPSPAES